jgi:sulfate/thiosulfate-binding protein
MNHSIESRNGLLSAVLIALAVLPAGLWLHALPAPARAAESRTLVLAVYSVPKEAYDKHIIPAFQRQWKQKTGEELQIRTSYGASGAQARAVIGGFEADVVALSLEGDVDQIAKAGLITHDWRSGADRGMITGSVVALGVRKGNPKGIKGWEDLAKPGVAVLYPNPKTSGGAMWDIIAIYGGGVKLAPHKAPKEQPDKFAADLLKRIQKNVKVMDKSGRESVTTFERGVGDVIVTYENELLPRIKGGRPYDLVLPAETVFIENPVALVDRHAEKHKVRDAAEAFVAFLHGEEAQRAFRALGFRPVGQAAGGAAFPVPPHLFTSGDLGGWAKVESLLFGPQGIWTRTVEDLAQGR